MKDLGMNPSRKSTHYLITMTTFAHHSLAETWNFVAFVTGTQVFTCAMNFKLCQIYWKKKYIEKHFPSYRKLCWYKMCHSAFPFSPQSLHAGRGSPHLQCLVLLSQKELCKESHCCKNSAQRRNKNKTITCAQPHSPGQLFPSKVEEIGDKAWEKLLSPIPECAIPNCSSYSSFSHCERLHSTSSLLLELLKGSAPTVCIALNNQDQVTSGIPRVMGSSQTRNNIPVLPQDGQSLLEQDSLHLQQSTARAEIVTEKCFAVFWVLILFLHVL